MYWDHTGWTWTHSGVIVQYQPLSIPESKIIVTFDSSKCTYTPNLQPGTASADSVFILDVSVKVAWSWPSGNGKTSLPLTLHGHGHNGHPTSRRLGLTWRCLQRKQRSDWHQLPHNRISRCRYVSSKWMSSGAVDEFHCFPVITVVPGLLCICRAPWTSTHCPEWRRKW